MENSLTFLSQTDIFIKRHKLQIKLLKTIIDKNNIKINKLFNLLPSKNPYSDTYFEIELDIQDLFEINEELEVFQNFRHFLLFKNSLRL
ncbi:hypothetical protein [Chrysanthemum yellows phytoplasma]|uniref:hypothetical protein n=1 Tax=Chrysanthemum yellows phytoplasma TaxID=238674 RepID=UPI00054CC900|nr:hypothetical protein [Chrysanthemum yellows phytoplasma]